MLELMNQMSVGAQDDLRAAVRKRLMAASKAGVGGRHGEDGAKINREEDDPSAPMGDGVMEKNLGVPMVVVGCKADMMQSETFEQQQRLHFVQQSLRRFCLKC